MQKINIKIPNKEYPVFLGEGIFVNLPNILVKQNIKGNLFLVIDSNVNKLYRKGIIKVFNSVNGQVKSIVIHSSEKNKSFEVLQKIHTGLIKNNFDRDSTLVAIGGGIIGDISGFAAATFMRGIKYIQIPTTLLASVDSSVGGKTGINFNNTKNIIGSFHQPEMVLIDTRFFNTLPYEERLCGLGEIVKYCFLTNRSYYNFVRNNIDAILSNETKVINKVITESIKFKGNVVESDEKESGIRKILNLGHTFAHAFEVEQNHKLKHGQAVIVGITCSIYLSKSLNLISDSNFTLFLNFLLLFTNKIKLRTVSTSKIYNLMKKDKKNRSKEIKFVLAKEIGNILTDVPASKKMVIDSITKAISHF